MKEVTATGTGGQPLPKRRQAPYAKTVFVLRLDWRKECSFVQKSKIK